MDLLEGRISPPLPLGPLGFNFAQHSPTTRPSVERTAEKAFMCPIDGQRDGQTRVLSPHATIPSTLEREIFIDNLLVRVHLIIEIILVDRPCATGV